MTERIDDPAHIDPSQPYEPDAPDVIDEEFEGEAVLVQLGTGCYYSLNPTASAIWQAFKAGRSSSEVSAGLGRDLDEVLEFVNQLVAEKLLRATDSSVGAVETEADGVPTGAPVLQRFTDMQDLLMLDPIHDINLGGDGWPVVPEQA